MDSVIVVGGGIGGLSAALALAGAGLQVRVLERAQVAGEIGAGMQLGPNAFHAFDALGIGPAARSRAVYIDCLQMMDALDGAEVVNIPTGEAFRERFRGPYAVIHRADVHSSLLEGIRARPEIVLETGVQVERIEQTEQGVRVYTDRMSYDADAVVGADGGRSVIREQYVGDAPRVSGHVVYRAVVDATHFPDDLKLNAPVVWAGPDCHLVHYPLRNAEQYNVVVTFHSRHAETWSVTEGSREEVVSYFTEILPRPRQLIDLPRSWKRWATADRNPIGRWTFGRATLLGDAAHPMLQYLAQGACMALEDAVTLGAAVRAAGGDLVRAFAHYEKSRVARTARVALLAREMGRIYHAKGVERLVRNQMWKDRAPERFYDALEWLYGWSPERCLA
ncbi:MAG: 3-hydroxybenzoate 6-monooxygenase [Burkholderiales bacterium]